MPLSLKLEGASKAQLVVSLAALLLSDVKAEITPENIDSVLKASGNEAPTYISTLYSTYIAKAGGVSKFLAGPSAGGGGGGAAPAGINF